MISHVQAGAYFFFSSRRRHTRYIGDWSSDVCSSDLGDQWGRDVLDKAIKGSQVSIAVGVAAALCATLIGTLLGAFAGFYGRWEIGRASCRERGTRSVVAVFFHVIVFLLFSCRESFLH